MFFRHKNSHTPSRRRRFVTVLALVAYLASVTGYPLPLPAGPRDTSTPYPCQGHACGCQSAAQCWDNCCCYSPAERLAWIRAHGITLPAATLEMLQSQAEVPEKSCPEKSCCQSERSTPAGCSHCDSTAGCDHSHAETAADSQTRMTFEWVDAIAAQKCQGLTTLWLVSGANIPVEILTPWEFDWQVVGSICLPAVNLISLSHAPSVPPPCENSSST